MAANDPLSLPATPGRLRAVAEPAGLDDRAIRRAVELAASTPVAADWQQFLARALALLGAALLLSGVVSFVAFNWQALGRFAKLGLVAAAITGAALLGWARLPRLSGQIAVAVAAVLVGPLLGLYGQAYQTGADPYELFRGWLLLIVPWLIAARFAALWVFAAALLDLTLVLYWVQVLGPLPGVDWLHLAVVIAILHALLVAAWEWQLAAEHPWFAETWAAYTLALTGWSALVVAVGYTIVEPSRAGSGGFFALVLAAICFGATWYWHRRVRPDRFLVAAAVVSALGVLSVLAGRVIFDVLDLEEFGMLLMALVIIGEIALGLRWWRGSTLDTTAEG